MIDPITCNYDSMSEFLEAAICPPRSIRQRGLEPDVASAARPARTRTFRSLTDTTIFVPNILTRGFVRQRPFLTWAAKVGSEPLGGNLPRPRLQA